MADNNLARSRNDLPDFFADDDPLAELARIVGYDDLPVVARPPAAPSSSVKREPAFNLEDELLREFEQYDAPRLDPVNDIALDELPHRAAEPQPAMFAPVVETPVFEPSAFEPEQVRFVPEEIAASDAAQAGFDDLHADAPPYVEPETSYVADLAQEVSVYEPDAEEPVEASRFEPIFDLPNPVVESAAAQMSATPVADEFDLAAELESSMGAESVTSVEPQFVPVPQADVRQEPKSKAYVPGFRMPLANFNLARGDVMAEGAAGPLAAAQVTEAVEPKFDLPVLDDFPAPKPAAPSTAETWTFEKPAVQQPVAQVELVSAPEPVKPQVAKPEPPKPAPVVAAKSEQFSALDDLIYDVQRYSLPTGATPAASVSWSHPAPIARVVSPAVPAAAAAVVAAPIAETTIAEKLAPEEQDPFLDEEFELSLNELELDLADIVVEEAVTVAPAVKVEAQAVQPEAPAAPVSHPVSVEPEAVEEVEAVADLPFDPAQIADSEDQVEAIAELDVPALPVEEPEQPPAYRADYDLDIDAELASLLMTQEKSDAAPAAKPKADPTPTVSFTSYDRPAQAPRTQGYSDLDDFERALEEDFRRSLSTPLAPVDHEEMQYADSDYVATVENARRSVRSWAVPMALVGVVVLGGLGAYALLGSGVRGVVSGGEPVVIAADTDPVKIAPENPGGKTVPNQDKAVYDRVAGVASQTPKQSSLISTNEQPVDVVQKTLMPDTLPLEGENDIEPTDVGETQDPRLLPQQTQQAALPAEQQPVAVMPRKVKTMIVRPDGKLVEQEVPAPALAAPEPAKMPAAGAKVTEVASIPDRMPASAQAAPAAGQAGIVPVSAPISAVTQKPGQVAPVSAAAMPAAAAPAQQSAPAASTRAPVPVSRPAEQPVNVVAAVTDQGTVRAPGQSQAASSPPAPASTQVASLGDGGYVVQIASLPSQAEAQKSYQSLSSKFGTVIGGRGVDIKAAEIAGKGTFYRVRIPAGSKNDAIALCEKYRAAGGSCLVGK